MEDTATERHPFRALLKFALVIAAIAAISKVVAAKKEEYYGLTESEAREKFESKLGPRIGEDKASEVADQVIPRLKDSGVIKPDPVERVVDEAKDAVAKAGDTVEAAVEEVKEKVD